MERTDIFIAGVGGQGSLSASQFLGEAAVAAGLDVQVGEIHGMAQRGGVVESTVRIGSVHGPIISDGQADVLLGFEPIETVRALGKANAHTLVITNTHPLVPATLSMKGEPYPELQGLIGHMRAVSQHVIALDATDIAKQAGNAQAMGSVLLGVLAASGRLPFDASVLRQVILERVPARAREVNGVAFDRGVSDTIT